MFSREKSILCGACSGWLSPFTTAFEVQMGAKRKRKATKRRATKKRRTARKPARRAKKKTKKRKGARRRVATKKAAKKKTKRKPNPQFMKPVQPDAQLAAVVGSKPLPRTEITKKLWSYIKRNGLQDSKNRRMINADANLKPVFGGKTKVSMFEMTKLVNKHVK